MHFLFPTGRSLFLPQTCGISERAREDSHPGTRPPIGPLDLTAESQRHGACHWENPFPGCSSSTQPAGFCCLKKHVANDLPLFHHLAQPGYQAEESAPVHQHRSGVKPLPLQTQKQQSSSLLTFKNAAELRLTSPPFIPPDPLSHCTNTRLE